MPCRVDELQFVREIHRGEAHFSAALSVDVGPCH